MKKVLIISPEKYEELRSAAAACRPTPESETKNLLKEQMTDVLHDESKPDSEKWSLYSAYLNNLLNKREGQSAASEAREVVYKKRRRKVRTKKTYPRRSYYLRKLSNRKNTKWLVE